MPVCVGDAIRDSMKVWEALWLSWQGDCLRRGWARMGCSHPKHSSLKHSYLHRPSCLICLCVTLRASRSCFSANCRSLLCRLRGCFRRRGSPEFWSPALHRLLQHPLPLALYDLLRYYCSNYHLRVRLPSLNRADSYHSNSSPPGRSSLPMPSTAATAKLVCLRKSMTPWTTDARSENL